MPALWPASQKPMYIRTVWVAGCRHAVLSEDDPYFVRHRLRPHSSATYSSKHNPRTYQKETLEDCLKKLNLAITTDKPDAEKHDFHIDLNDDDDIVLTTNQQPLCEFDTNRIKFTNLDGNMKHLRTNRPARAEVKESTELSDRVLQWLDLAGKVDLLAPDENERMSQPRRSWPEIQRRNHSIVKSKTAVDLRVKEVKTNTKSFDSAREQPNVNIDRHNFCMPSSANTIESYARRSRHVKSTPAGGGHARNKTDKNKTSIQTNVLEARKRLASERHAVEKQYTELVNKKIIPDLGKSTKKQVHIFMPEAISKKINSNSSSRTESLLTLKS